MSAEFAAAHHVGAVSHPLTLFPPPAPPAPDPVVARHPVGVLVQTAAGPEGLATATFDVTQQYRYRLSRVWDPSGPRCVFAMLNPSTATALTLDATVSRCVRFAKAWSYGALEVVNVFAYRATNPKDMAAQDDPIGPGNDEALLAAGKAGDLVVAAWGVHAELDGRGEVVRRLFDQAGLPLHYLRLTKAGHPGHPLYIPAATRPTRWGHQ
ncbi:MAG: DUF1643 domain-containing protein [Propionicimonas sp.]